MENAKLKLTHRAWAKVLAVIALAVFSAATAIFATALVGADSVGAYSGFFNPSDYDAGIERTVAVYAYQLRYWGIPLLVVSLAAAASCLVFLFYSAGHRGETDEVRLGWFDKIPLDLLLAALTLAFCFVIQLGIEWSWYMSGAALILLMALCCLVDGLLLLAALMTVAVRVKVGGGVWWRGTVIFWALHLVWRWARAIWRWLCRRWHNVSERLPIIWRTVLVGGALVFFEMLLSAFAFNSYSGTAALLWFAYNAVIFLALCFGGWQMKSIKTAGEKLAEGELDYTVDTAHMYWEFKRHAENLNSIGEGMGAAVEKGMKSERLKTELITNVSHDIKTPLTSIVNYVDLLQKTHTPEQESEYLAVLDRQSKRLKKLTEDLVEASKASTGNMSVNLVPTNVGEIINQSLGEYTERLTAGKLEAVVTIHAPVVSVLADGRLLWRVMDNLFSNVCKYALAGTRVYVDVWASDSRATVAVKNISRAPLNMSADELMERFVRGDTSRSTEGSGLGLSIARSLVELQKGSFAISTDGDLFKAEIQLPLA